MTGEKISKEALILNVKGTADYRMRKYREHPDDRRNLARSNTLSQIAEFLEQLPNSHPLFAALGAANEKDGERWAEIESQFISRWGFFDTADVRDFGFRFVNELTRLARVSVIEE